MLAVCGVWLCMWWQSVRASCSPLDGAVYNGIPVVEVRGRRPAYYACPVAAAAAVVHSAVAGTACTLALVRAPTVGATPPLHLVLLCTAGHRLPREGGACVVVSLKKHKRRGCRARVSPGSTLYAAALALCVVVPSLLHWSTGTCRRVLRDVRGRVCVWRAEHLRGPPRVDSGDEQLTGIAAGGAATAKTTRTAHFVIAGCCSACMCVLSCGGRLQPAR
jgi:hypothetical protein